ncbi:hypothetical protein MCOR14_002265 [Pyricularia oryzae]|nr:hypothetical protein MCOR34_005093 [Pyricularia oryzae]KAI6455334.1 hypothetical protein MCOR17_008712 [Pyricularia oryzae]KAI6500233.1 hypothetical protein MCOR13_006015 [Pyricularia oryzae]KAI6563713.1 hypothetical protein MCOR04_009152 [Pyricularia oryzae]KAI6643116.1 hypothetical protein MCOR14_002265 [Pyricularia oryzae]
MSSLNQGSTVVSKPQALSPVSVEACLRSNEYPSNLPRNSMSRRVLKEYQTQLESRGKTLFVHSEVSKNNPTIPSQDLYSWTILQAQDDEDYTKSYSCQLPELESQLSTQGKEDPRCRLIFIESISSNRPLDGSRQMMRYLLSYHHVSPRFLDLLFLFCRRRLPPNDTSFVHSASFYQDNLVDNLCSPTRYAIPPLGRSGRQLRLCYNFWAAETNEVGEGEPGWFFRQTATYHSLDVETGKSFWINVKANDVMGRRMEEIVEDEARPSKSSPRDEQVSKTLLNSLDLHMVAAEWSTECWPGFTQDIEAELSAIMGALENVPVSKLEEALNVDTAELLREIITPGGQRDGIIKALRKATTGMDGSTTSPGQGSQGHQGCGIPLDILRGTTQKLNELVSGSRPIDDCPTIIDPFRYLEGFRFEQLQRLSRTGARLHQASLIMEMNINVLSELVGFYTLLQEADELPRRLRSKIKGGVRTFQKRVECRIKTIKTEKARIEVLQETVASGKTLCESIIQFRNMGISQLFLIAAHQTAADMRKIADKTERETASMHIITLVTLIFLPGTFVATFFGSGLFQWDDNDPELEFPRWKPEYFKLFAGICFPLMTITILGWLMASSFGAKKSRVTTELKTDLGETPKSTVVKSRWWFNKGVVGVPAWVKRCRRGTAQQGVLPS